MNKQMFLSPEVKVNFRMRDFFLDFMACIVPGLTFLIFITTLIGGLFIIAYKEIPEMAINIFSSDKQNLLSHFMSSFAFNLWFILIIVFLAYFTGHLLYRQSPKRPDYASFLRIRNRVMGKQKDIWVVDKGKGIRTEDVQFPYSNLSKYLETRGFKHISDYVKWKSDSDKEHSLGQRSKTIINSAKMRISFFFPDQTNSLLRNEAHIRLASSMWYASKYTIKAAYICALFTIFIIFNNSVESYARISIYNFLIFIAVIFAFLALFIFFLKKYKKIIDTFIYHKIDEKSSFLTVVFLLFIMIAAYFILIELYLVFINKMYIQDSASIFLILLILGLFFGKLSKFFAASIMHRFPTDTAGNTIPQEEEKVQRLASRLDMLWKIYDRSPAFVLFIFLASIQFNIFSLKLEKFHFWYLGIILFVLLGALFAKHYIEESMHYQRIRELVYVLETAFIAKVLNNDNLPNPLKIEKFDYEISLNLDRKLKILEAKKE